ncbi:hypothetical protein BLOT_002599 [Blomia tropicalis]|nr:hypothetical protein BLOT_002599 [Blomia tropicalis]
MDDEDSTENNSTEANEIIEASESDSNNNEESDNNSLSDVTLSDNGYYDENVFFVSNDDLVVVQQEEDNDDDATDIELVNYNIDLPLEHSYLGELENIQSGRKIFSDGEKVRIPMFFSNGIILIPGQEIPFTFRNESLISFFRNVINNHSKTFGVSFSPNSNSGTTAEIRSYSYTEDGILSIRAEGRQRFKFQDLDDENVEFGVRYAYVTIRPEIELKDFFYSLKRCEKNYITNSSKHIRSSVNLPECAFKQFDVNVLMKKLRVLLDSILKSNNKHETFNYPLDATAFSYFVLSCIPFSDRMKINLLDLNCTVTRLRAEYGLLSFPFEIQCSSCGIKLCSNEDFLVMSKCGTGGAYVNSIGFLHELFTFSKVSNVSLMSSWTEEYSWFPNYGWIIIRCSSCLIHLGWKFKTKLNINPKVFWAITR